MPALLLILFYGVLHRQLRIYARSALVQASLRCPSRRSMLLHMKQSQDALQRVAPPPGCRWACWAMRRACMRCTTGQLCTVKAFGIVARRDSICADWGGLYTSWPGELCVHCGQPCC